MKWLKRSFIILLFIVGLGLVFNQQIANYFWSQQQTVLDSNTAKANEKVSYDYSKIKPLSSTEMLQAQLSQNHVVGVVLIPQLNLNVVISNGVSPQKLAIGASTLRPHQQMGSGNYAIAGHNMGNGSQILFGPLYTSAKAGQTAYLSDLKNVYQYQIYLVKQIAATDVKVVNNTKDNILTMTTCNNDGSARILVRAKLVKSFKYDAADKKLQKQLVKHIKS